MTDTSWPQWMQIAWRRLVENEQPSPADARYALLLLAQAAEALEVVWQERQSLPPAELEVGLTGWSFYLTPEKAALVRKALDRIRAGDGGE